MMRSANASMVGNSSGVKNCQGPGSTRDGGEAASGRHGSSPLMTPARAAAPLTRASAAPVKTSRRRTPSLMTHLVGDACANANGGRRFQFARTRLAASPVPFAAIQPLELMLTSDPLQHDGAPLAEVRRRPVDVGPGASASGP